MGGGGGQQEIAICILQDIFICNFVVDIISFRRIVCTVILKHGLNKYGETGTPFWQPLLVIRK